MFIVLLTKMVMKEKAKAFFFVYYLINQAVFFRSFDQALLGCLLFNLFCHSEQGSETTAVETSQKILDDELELKDRYKLRQVGIKNSYFMILF